MASVGRRKKVLPAMPVYQFSITEAILKRHARSYPKVFADGKWRDAHRVVMEQYLGRPLDRCEIVHHINGDILDYRIENLELMLLAEHTKAHKAGKRAPKVQGSNRSTAKLNEAVVKEIRIRLQEGSKQSELARDYGVHPTLIGQVKSRKRWSHVP